MRVLFDILHPAHVHIWEPVAERVRERGGEVLLCAREKDVTIALLEAKGLPYEVLSGIGGGKLGLVGELAVRAPRLLARIRSFRPDVLVGVMGPLVAPLGRLLGIPSLVLYDNETSWLTNRLAFATADRFCCPRWSYRQEAGVNVRRFEGVHALAYLHPNRFTPDPSVLASLDLPERFCVARLVSWEASHDQSDGRQMDAVAFVRALAEELPVVLSSERDPGPELRQWQRDVPPEHLHHLLAAASLYVGEGLTTGLESVVLGTPAVILHPLAPRFGIVQHLEDDERLLRSAAGTSDALEAARALLAEPPADYAARHAAWLERCVDLAPWLHRRIEQLHHITLRDAAAIG